MRRRYPGLAACLIAALVAFQAPARADDWSAASRTAASAALAGHVLDWGTTRNIVERPGEFHEVNPLLGEHPTMGQVNRHFIVGGLAVAGIAHVLPDKWRSRLLTVYAVTELGFAANNMRIGLRVSF